jgi:hypothetical protein
VYLYINPKKATKNPEKSKKNKKNPEKSKKNKKK